MKTLVVLAVLVVGGYFSYQKFIKKSAAVVAYEKFADLLARGRYPQAKELATGDAVTAVSSLEATGLQQVGPSIGGSATPFRDQAVREIAGPVVSTSHRIEQQTTSADGNGVHLSAVSNVCRERPGCTGAMGQCNACVDVRHEVEMCLEGGEWKVCVFSQL